MTPADGGLAFDLAGHRLVIPPPVWTAPGDEPVEQAQTLYTELAPGVESLVLISRRCRPRSPGRAAMGILAVNRAGYTAATQLASVIDPITAACAGDELYATTFGGGERGAVLLMCGHYKPNAPGVPRRCGGGIILATVLESTLGAAKIYHEWCTPGFDVEDRPNWPVVADDIAAYAEVLMTISSSRRSPRPPATRGRAAPFPSLPRVASRVSASCTRSSGRRSRISVPKMSGMPRCTVATSLLDLCAVPPP